VLIDKPGFCERHQKLEVQRDRDRRGSASERGYGSKWQRAADAYKRLNPLCVYCQKQGRVSAAYAVDHITPHNLKRALDSGDRDWILQAQHLFWSQSNWQSLCQPCHNSVKQIEERSHRRA
jgi:5-methylcytosine-specific restriction endonuclease McrA